MKSALNDLKDYQMVLNRIAELEKLLSFVPDDIQVLEKQWNNMEKRLEELTQRKSEQETKIKSQETALTEANEREKKYQKDLTGVTNSKEYNAVLKEIDIVKKQIGNLNDDIAERMVDQEEIEKNMDECAQLAKDSKEQYDAQLSQYRTSLESYRTELDERIAERDAIAERIPDALKKQFHLIASRRNGVGLALCVNSVCMSCNVRVRPAVVDSLRSKTEILKCDSCHRILFYEEPEEA